MSLSVTWKSFRQRLVLSRRGHVEPSTTNETRWSVLIPLLHITNSCFIFWVCHLVSPNATPDIDIYE
jgi:hypothetical protein